VVARGIVDGFAEERCAGGECQGKKSCHCQYQSQFPSYTYPIVSRGEVRSVGHAKREKGMSLHEGFTGLHVAGGKRG